MIQHITPRLLRDWPLPMPLADGDKNARGYVVIIAGSREMPGAVLLAATAALRAGAGKLAIVTADSVAPHVGVAVPEARVIGLRETAEGGLIVDQRPDLQAVCRQASAVLIGPGMQDETACCQLVRALLPDCIHAPLILDAAGMSIVSRDADCGAAATSVTGTAAGPGQAPAGGLALAVAGGAVAAEAEALAAPVGGFRFASPVLLTPHAGELASLTGADKDDIRAQPAAAAPLAAQRWQATVALKGALTVIADVNHQEWHHEGGNTGLAISGSGDVLAGIIAGLAARGAPLGQAAAWGVALHAMAGEQLALKHGPQGYLAREISTEVPALLRAMAAD
ncbi:NAD(P)H-hydrate dehydratase [Pseudoduganella sp. FT55W]|uniref:ADP-dependent (S)-NAD(P)H-hydrate dehydratase n=1 Tax=Duganella rivi TaxID=2666083 RepID=A0A7X4GQR1_9BURK|nr:NAD(P)H-hydrate dehydratase [Duganella rivi]MYM66947.1 NAD(P)H-hydrate dehydratase [Duganella rivi]